MSDLTFVRGDDWCGLYVDGRLVTQGHDLEIRDFAAFANVALTEQWADLNWLESMGELPTFLADVRLQAK